MNHQTTQAWIRLFDVLLASLGMVLALPFLILIAFLLWFDTGSPLFRQTRVGRHGRPFTLVKFRTMRPGTASVATHLADPSAVTRLGGFLRKTKLDELPQLWNVLRGEMSLVGPRPCLPTQHELIAMRDRLGVQVHRPGITGLAQISGIDMSMPELLAETDARMLADMGLRRYFGYIALTALGRGAGDSVRRD